MAIFRQQFTVPLRKELNDSRFEVVHRACNLYTAGGFEIPLQGQFGTATFTDAHLLLSLPLISCAVTA